MSGADGKRGGGRRRSWHLILNWRLFRYHTALAAGLLALVLALTLILYVDYYKRGLGPAQPISFSHRVHAADKQISCVMCHTGVTSHMRAALPPLQTCMICHSQIIITHPEVQKVRRHFAAKEPVAWARVTKLPDFAFFNHSAHIRRAVDCGGCHGNINRMDRIALYRELTMGFCVTCHKRSGASHDCLICHR